jgi:transposase InsO family protein
VAEANRIGVTRAATNMGVSRNTVYRWRRRGEELADRSSRPRRSPRQTSSEHEAALLALRLETGWGPDRIGPLVGLSRRTAYRILRRYRMHQHKLIFPTQPRTFGTFVATTPGEVVQIDIKSFGSLARGGGKHQTNQRSRERERIGWTQLHMAVDAASRHAFVQVRRSLGTEDCIAFLEATLGHFDALGIRVQRVLTDNGTGYRRRFAEACAALGVRRTRTKPYHPWTNGRVERFNRTLQRECVYAGEHFTSDEARRYAIALWVASYNADRPHTALGGLSPDDWLRARAVTEV